jgi:beta-1,4-N-acetylglucosaminyltransferase
MILVTVGSTNHNDLIKAIDELIAEKKITEKVVCQIGKGNYIPKNCDFFRFDLEIDKNYYQKCKTIICVDSAGTIFRNLELGNKIIAVRHPTTKGSLDLGRNYLKINIFILLKNILN